MRYLSIININCRTKLHGFYNKKSKKNIDINLKKIQTIKSKRINKQKILHRDIIKYKLNKHIDYEHRGDNMGHGRDT